MLFVPHCSCITGPETGEGFYCSQCCFRPFSLLPLNLLAYTTCSPSWWLWSPHILMLLHPHLFRLCQNSPEGLSISPSPSPLLLLLFPQWICINLFVHSSIYGVMGSLHCSNFYLSTALSINVLCFPTAYISKRGTAELKLILPIHWDQFFQWSPTFLNSVVNFQSWSSFLPLKPNTFKSAGILYHISLHQEALEVKSRIQQLLSSSTAATLLYWDRTTVIPWLH